MATVHFLYRSVREKGKLEVRLQHTHRQFDKVTNYIWTAKTKIEVEKEYWTKYHKANVRDITIKNIQTEIMKLLTPLDSYIMECFKEMQPENISKEWLQTIVDHYYNPTNEQPTIPTELINYIDFYIDYRKHEIKETSIKKFNVIKHKLQRFEACRKKPILIKDINDSFKKEFVDYCKSQKYAQNTMQRELVFIKTFCKHARFLGLETHPQLDSLRLDRAKVEKIYLTFDELEQIEKIDKEKLTDSLDNAKDWLVISCYTGQRVSDFMRFTDEQIRIEDGKHLIEFTQKKTGKNMTVPLHPKVLEILKKRNGKFPYAISDQKYNEYIKDVCEIAELKQLVKGSKKTETIPESGIFRKETKAFKKYELVTSHIGRRSFATNFYGKIPTTYLIYVTGHSTEAMFLNYIGKSNKDLAMEITNYF